MKRSGKFYRKNEADVMRSLGLKPTKNSGSGWIEKEDGQNDYIICQLKSTDAASIKVNQKDIRILEYNASVASKLPVFAIQFLNTNEVWLMMKPEDVEKVAQYIETGECDKPENMFGVDGRIGEVKQKPVRVISGGRSCGRTAFMEELEKKYEKKSKSAL